MKNLQSFMKNLQSLKVILILFSGMNFCYAQLVNKDIFQNDTYPNPLFLGFFQKKHINLITTQIGKKI